MNKFALPSLYSILLISNGIKMDVEFEQQLNAINLNNLSSNGREEHEPGKMTVQVPSNAPIIDMNADVGDNRPIEELELSSATVDSRMVASNDLDQSILIPIPFSIIDNRSTIEVSSNSEDSLNPTAGDNSSTPDQNNKILTQNYRDITQNVTGLESAPSAVPNAVDFILEFFSPDLDSKGTQDLDRSSAAFTEIDHEVCSQLSESSEETDNADENYENFQFDRELGSSYGFTEISVSILFYCSAIILR